ncbi:hypothetical protein TNIN_386501 [Trichonephila inaurata madagascariensis]|uniref:Transposase n=1 Tax=Trichonephila inaurata madagascariensis TaxID=2747483 RepID=A0A8X6XQ79_9ARAC|nr:hypothetical protein TNIN_386501 [Trichonephila inaurata madagascariensis]
MFSQATSQKFQPYKGIHKNSSRKDGYTVVYELADQRATVADLPWMIFKKPLIGQRRVKELFCKLYSHSPSTVQPFFEQDNAVPHIAAFSRSCLQKFRYLAVNRIFTMDSMMYQGMGSFFSTRTA